MPDLENHGTEATSTPSDCTKLFGIIVLLVNHVHLIENLLRFLQADAVFALDFPALLTIEVEAHRRRDITVIPLPASPWRAPPTGPHEVLRRLKSTLRTKAHPTRVRLQPYEAWNKFQSAGDGRSRHHFPGRGRSARAGDSVLIGHLEIAAREAIKQHLEPGYGSVGAHVDVRRLAATPMRAQVRFLAEVIGQDDRRVRCRVEAYDAKEEAAGGRTSGTHVRRFASRVQAQAAGQ